MSPQILRIINQLFEAEKKASRTETMQPIQKNLERIRAAVEDLGYRIVNPTGELYHEGRTDCECSIAGDVSRPLYIAEVLKPAVYEDKPPAGRSLIQKAVVIADNR